MIRRMCRERSKDDQVSYNLVNISFVQYLEVCGGVLQGFLDLLLVEIRRGHFNQEFLFACR